MLGGRVVFGLTLTPVGVVCLVVFIVVDLGFFVVVTDGGCDILTVLGFEEISAMGVDALMEAVGVAVVLCFSIIFFFHKHIRRVLSFLWQ